MRTVNSYVSNIFIPNVKLSGISLEANGETGSLASLIASGGMKGPVNVTITPSKNEGRYDVRLSEQSSVKKTLVSSLNKVSGGLAKVPNYLATAGIGIAIGGATIGKCVQAGATAAAGGLVKGGKFLYRKLKASPAAIKKALTTYPGRAKGAIKKGFRIAWGGIKQGAGTVGSAAHRASDATRGAVSSVLFKLAANIEPQSSSLARQDPFASGEYASSNDTLNDDMPRTQRDRSYSTGCVSDLPG